MKIVFRALAIALLTAGSTGCERGSEAAATPPSAQSLSAVYKAKAAEVGRRLALQDRAAEAAHRAEMDRLIDASVLQMRDSDRTTSLFLQLRNRSAKSIRSLDAALEVHLRSTGRRVGLAELHLTRGLSPHEETRIWLPVRYVRFGEDTASMRLAQGQPKCAILEVTEIRYADGSDAGYDD